MNSPCGLPTKWRETINCGCKINLRLKVVGKRPDKLHELSSCFVFLEHPGDTLTVEQPGGNGLELSCPGHPELEGDKNLLWRAAELYAAEAGIEPSWRIILEKNVPIAAGLGGGSAGAGALLALLNGKYRRLTDEQLNLLAFRLGADVPFFLKRQTAWVSGAGEKMEFLTAVPPLPEVMIVNPGFPVSARWAYSELIGADDPEEKRSFLAGQADWRSFCRNDLAPALFRKFPLLELLRDELYHQGALAVQVSGSGSSLFALFDGGSETAAMELKRDFPAELKIFTGSRTF